MTVKYHTDLIQGSESWHDARCGLLTASEMKLILTPTLKIASNDKERAHLYELLAQRITRYVEPHYVGDDMLRGINDEVEARILYAKHHAPVQDVGFITNDKWGFTIGYSPDGLVGDAGQLECKSRRQKYQVQTIIENVCDNTIPVDFVMQCQTGLLVSERAWLDFVSVSFGLPFAVVRVYPDPVIQDAIVQAAGEFERRLSDKLEIYNRATSGMIATKRKIEQEMFA
jgi:hypothetical protein